MITGFLQKCVILFYKLHIFEKTAINAFVHSFRTFFELNKVMHQSLEFYFSIENHLLKNKALLSGLFVGPYVGTQRAKCDFELCTLKANSYYAKVNFRNYIT